jgi:ABC-2 type transport system permease protein
MASARIHGLIRFASILVLTASTVYMAGRSNLRADLTAEGLSEITPSTRELITSVSAERPVVVNAYVSKEVPRSYVATRSRLLNILREMQASAGPGLQVRIHEPDIFSEQAQEAVELYGIEPRGLYSAEGGRVENVPVFMGLALTSGPREEVIPFLEKGLSVEYEVVRALTVVTAEKKRVIGVLRTDAKIMGDFDIQARRQIPAWRIAGELRKQYEVRSLNPGAEVPPDVDALIVPQLSSMDQPSLGFLEKYLDAGRPALLVADPMPTFDVRLSPREPMLPPPNQQGGMGGMGGQQGAPKGDYRGLLNKLGVVWDDERIVYDLENPNPQYEGVPPYIVFSGPRDGADSFAGGDSVVDGLTQVVTLFPGRISAAQDAKTSFVPLLKTGTQSGSDAVKDMIDRSNPFFGIRGPIMPRRIGPRAKGTQTLGARIEGGDENYKVILLADLDMFADDFFVLRERGGDRDGDGLIDDRIDNVTFLLNCLDTLVGDDGFVELRKRQPVYRRLDAVETYTKDANDLRQQKIDEANDDADAQLEAAQKALDDKVAQIDAQTDIDETTKDILKKSAQKAEQRRLDLKKAQIKREKGKSLDRIEAEHMRAVDEVRDRIRIASILFPPIPALFLGLLIFMRKRRREQANIPANRKRSAS